MGKRAETSIIEIRNDRSAICRAILDALPDWFGIPEAIDDYSAEAAALPMIGASSADGKVLGFLSLRRQTDAVCEIYVLGVMSDWHGRGIGRRLMEAAAQRARQDGARYLSVKTLAPEAGDPAYLRTLGFYEALSFVPVEVFPTLWSPGNPCLLMIKPI